jgi:hypothetical protein
MQPDRNRVDATAEDHRDLGVGELFPGGELQDLGVVVTQTAEGVRQPIEALVLAPDGMPIGGALDHPVPLEARNQAVAADLPPPGVRQDVPGDTEEPGKLAALRYVVEAPPGGEEHLGDHVVSSRGVGRTAQGVGPHRAPVALEEETVALL